MKKKCKTIFIVLLTIIIFFTTISYGYTINELNGTQDEEAVTSLQQAGNSIVKVITTIGIILSVIMLVVLGIKYMLGSTEEKAEYKKTLIPYVIGAGLVFAASSIAQLIYDLAINM